MKTEKLLGIATFIIIFLIGIAYYQDKVIEKYKNITEQIDTTSVVIKRDTVLLELERKDTVPVIIKETTVRVDTLYQQNEDSTYSEIPIPLKKKSMRTH